MMLRKTEQLKRYLNTFPNLILTNFLEFRLYRKGVHVETVMAGRPHTLNRLGTVPPLENEDELHRLLDRFLDFALPRDFTAETLADRTRQSDTPPPKCHQGTSSKRIQVVCLLASSRHFGPI